jgi:hypothetical protein
MRGFFHTSDLATCREGIVPLPISLLQDYMPLPEVRAAFVCITRGVAGE